MIKTYCKPNSAGTSSEDPFYAEFYDVVLQQELQLKNENEASADLFLGAVFPPYLRIADKKKQRKKILICGENLHYVSHFFVKRIIHLWKKLGIPFSYFPWKFFILSSYLRDIPLRQFYSKPRLKKIVAAPHHLFIGTNVPPAAPWAKRMHCLPLFVVMFYKRFSQFLLPRIPHTHPPKRFCCMVFSNVRGQSIERIKFMQKLSAYKPVDCYGRTCFNNMNKRSDAIPLPSFWYENVDFLSHYKFVICFENSFADDYVTEKLPNAMLAGSIPIYRGAPNVGQFFNTKSFINYENFERSYEKMIEEIIAIDQDEQRYQSYLKEPLFLDNKIPEIIHTRVEQTKQAIQQFLEK